MDEETCKSTLKRKNITTREQLLQYIKTLKHNDRIRGTDSREKIIAMAFCGQYYLQIRSPSPKQRGRLPSPKQRGRSPSRERSPSKQKEQEGGEGIQIVFSVLQKTEDIELPSSLSKETDIDNSLISTALAMMLDYFKHVEDKEDSSMTSKFINATMNTIKALIRIPLKFSQFVLTNKTLFSILFMLIKILKVVFCIWTSGLVNKKLIKKTIESVTKHFAGESEIGKAFSELLTEITTCFGNHGLNLALVGICLSTFVVKKLSGYNLSKFTLWIWTTLTSILSYATSKFSEHFSNLSSFQELIKDPSGSVAKMIFGKEFRTGDDVKFFENTLRFQGNIPKEVENNNFYGFGIFRGNTLPEKLVHFMKGESDIFILSVILNFIPVKFLKWFIFHLSDFMIENVQIQALQNLVKTFKKTTGSCLDLLNWIMTTSVDYEVIKYVILQMKDLFMDVIPCLFAKIKGYIIRLYDKDYDDDELVNCCGSNIQSAIELAMRKEFNTWSNTGEWIADSVQDFFNSGGLMFKSLRKRTLGWDGKSLSKGRRKFSGFKTKRSKIFKDGAGAAPDVVVGTSNIMNGVTYKTGRIHLSLEEMFNLWELFTSNNNTLQFKQITLNDRAGAGVVIKHDLYNIKIKSEVLREKLSKSDDSEIYPGVNEFKFMDIYSYEIDTSPTPITDGAHKKFHYKKSQPKKKIYLKTRVTSKKQQQ